MIFNVINTNIRNFYDFFIFLSIIFVIFSLFYHMVPNCLVKSIIFYMQEILAFLLFHIKNYIQNELYNLVCMISQDSLLNLHIFEFIFDIYYEISKIFTGIVLILIINLVFLIFSLLFQ